MALGSKKVRRPLTYDKDFYFMLYSSITFIHFSVASQFGT
jgi:hypothetical protein